jgi:hypothetical protein
MITAMTDILSTIATLLLLVAGFGGLVRAVRHDGFAGPGTGYRSSDELTRPPGRA